MNKRVATKHLFARLCCSLLLLTLFPLPLFPSSTANDLDTLVARIESRYGNMRGLAADFEQRYSGAGVRERRERGRLFLQRPRRMRWEYEPKPGKLFIVNDREAWFYSPADREATRADAAKLSDARVPFLFLLGQKNLRKEFRDIAFDWQDTGAGSTTRILRLTPKRKDTGIRELYLEATNDGQIVRVKQIDEAGAISEFYLTNVHENYLAPAEAFEFKPPTGVNVRKQK
ncbi:MAG: outer membrane lipoprotein chaperone LolA [Acidobacteria bacterium]|nr:outer membrane lipoprotein chaperone LolA [Acidobacteriota bacterium]